MLRRIYSVQKSAWVLLSCALVFVCMLMGLRMMGDLSPKLFLYVIQPLGALILAGVAFYYMRGVSDRVRRRSDKAYMVGSVIAIWFVIYFLSGLVTTYVKNTLVATPIGIFLNIVGYGVTAVAIEYARYSLMQLAGRRNVVWFGALVTVVFALSQINIAAFDLTYNSEQFVKFFVADIVPVLTSSLLLTYLAVSSGLPAMLVYRVGILAVTLLVPVLPNYDWYMIGVSSLLLAIAVYVVIDKSQQSTQPRHRKSKYHIYTAANVMFVVAMTSLILFMTGVFNYKPLVILSNSMQPVYSRGSVVVVRMGVDAMDIKKGDIIQYKHKQTGQQITHRVIDIQQAPDGSGGRVFITKGDNNLSQDLPVEETQLVGIVKAQMPYVGYPTIWLRSLL